MAVLGDVESQPCWRPDVLWVEIRSASTGVERRRGGESITFRAISRSQDTLELAFESTRGYQGRWRGQLATRADGVSTVIRVEESATVPMPLLRVMARLFFDPEKFAAEHLARLRDEVRRRSAAAPEGP